MLTVWPHLFHTGHLNNPPYHTAGWQQYLPNGPSRTNLFEAIFPRRLFLWSFPSDSRDYLLLAIENNWRESGDLPFLWKWAETIEKVRVKLWGKAICTLCGPKVWRDQPISPQWRNTVAKVKSFHKVAKVFTSKWRFQGFPKLGLNGHMSFSLKLGHNNRLLNSIKYIQTLGSSLKFASSCSFYHP